MIENTSYNLKIISSGENRIEIYKVNNYSILKGNKSKNSNGRKGTKRNNLSEEKKEIQYKNRRFTLNKARNNIIRLIQSNPDMRTFITLTFKIESDYKQSKKYLNTLFNKLRREFKNIKYIWVLEYGEKNLRLHYHILSNFKLPTNFKFAKSKERKCINHKNFEILFCKKYWKYGFADIRNLYTEGNTNIALYMSVYITKDLIDKQLNGYRIYGYSIKTLNKPIVTMEYTIRNIQDILKDFYKDFYLRYSNSYEIGQSNGVITYFDLYKKDIL